MSDKCKVLDVPGIQHGWICCQCKDVYNGDNREECKMCGHPRCDNPTFKEIVVQTSSDSIRIVPVKVDVDPQKAN